MKVQKHGVVVSSDMKQKLRALRIAAQLSIYELSKKADVSERTIKKLESLNDEQKRYREEILTKLTRELGVTLDVLFKPENKSTTISSFEYYEEHLLDIDRQLLPFIRDHHFTSKGILENVYQQLFRAYLNEHHVSLDIFTNHNQQKINSFLETIPKPNLIIHVDENLKSLSYICSPDQKLTIESPELFWDCQCDTPSTKLNDFPCPIHSSPLGTEVHARFSAGHVLIRYCGLEFFWRRSRALWPPSIDSFFMLKNLQSDSLFTEKHNSLLDIGSGTGFIGILVACVNPYITQLDLSDWMLTPYLYGMTNWFLNRKNREYVFCKGKIGLFTSGLDLQFEPYDVVICNPPYLPILDGFEELALESTVMGTKLLEDIILKNQSLGKRVYIQFSHLAEPEARLAKEKAGVTLTPIGEENEIPFRLTIIWDKPKYLKRLIDERGLIVKENSRHPYWHKIQTYRID